MSGMHASWCAPHGLQARCVLALTAVQVWGGSRKLFNAMHDASKQGHGSYVETFLMHAAVAGGLKASLSLTQMCSLQGPDHRCVQIVPVLLPETETSFHCCLADGQEIYERFLRSQDMCTHSTLLHPVRLLSACPLQLECVLHHTEYVQVKLCSDEWPREPGITPHGIPSRPTYGERDKLC